MNWIDIITGILLLGLTYALYRSTQKVEILNEWINMVASQNEFLNKKHDQLSEYYSTENHALEATIKELNSRNAHLVDELNTFYKDNSSLKEQIYHLKDKHPEELKKAREEALTKSRSVMRGQATEHLAPYIIKDTNPKDYRFMGNPVDYVIFEGLSDVLDGQADTIKSITFLDIKTGKSSLTKSQRRIRDAVNSSFVTFKVLNLDELVEKQAEGTVQDEHSVQDENGSNPPD
jgi:predicted Holliday junction resolvase-like endonuclease